MRVATSTLDRRMLPMDTDPTQALVAKLRQLPPERIAEVEDFVDFLKARAERAVQAEIKAVRAQRKTDADRR